MKWSNELLKDLELNKKGFEEKAKVWPIKEKKIEYFELAAEYEALIYFLKAENLDETQKD